MRPVVAVPVLALVGLGVWLLLRGATPTVTPIDDAPATAPASPIAPTPIGATMGGELASAPASSHPGRTRPSTGATDLKYGAVTVTLVPADGAPVPKSLSFDAQPLGVNHAQKPLPAEQEDGTWRYEALIVGRWRIRAFVPGYVDAWKDVDVRADGEFAVSIPLEIGGAAAWKVALTNLEVPELVRIALLDGRGVPIEGTYQTLATTLHAAPASVPALPAEGKVVGLKVGRYRLRASTVDGDPKEVAFEVRAGETASLEFTLPR